MIARLLLAVAFAVAACTPTAVASPSDVQPSADPGWRILRTIEFVDRPTGVAFARSGENAYELQIVVLGTGGGGCGQPRFAGFTTDGTTYVAKVERGPTPTDPVVCLAIHQTEFDVLVDRRIIPRSVTGLAMSERCERVGCFDMPVPFEP